MRLTRAILVVVLCVAVTHAVPVPEGSLRSQTLDRLMMVESENDTALRSKRTIGILRQLFPEISKDVNPESENRINEVAAESQNNEVRVQFADDETNQAANEAEPELTPLDDIEEASDDDNRNKRFLNFGFGASSGNGAGGAGSGTGSGNFLFDIIRQAADGAARAAGTVYRVVAGTQSLGLGLSASRDVGPAVVSPAAPSASSAAAVAAAAAASPSSTSSSSSATAPAASAPSGAASPKPPLVAGSGSSASQGDPAAGAPAAAAVTEAVPGPVTRLFVIANRGISNLIQDLILRLAATSERIVNFKARLITSII